MRDFIPSATVADLLGLSSPAAFLARRDRLEDDLYFPLPMPHSRRPLLWKADEVQAWIDRNGKPTQPGIDPETLAAGLASGKIAILEMARTA